MTETAVPYGNQFRSSHHTFNLLRNILNATTIFNKAFRNSMQRHKDQELNSEGIEPGDTFLKDERLDLSSTCHPNLVRESRSYEDLDTLNTVSIKGPRSHSLNRQENENCPNTYNKAIFQSDTGSKVGDNNIFVSSLNSKWDDPQRLHQLCESSQNIASNIPTNNVIHDSLIKDEGQVTTGRELDEKQSLEVDFKTLLTMFLKGSSISPLNRVGNSASIKRKVIWLLIMIMGVLGSVIQITQYLVAYFKYPVVVNIASKYSLDQEFPAVTVCNLNNVRNEFLPCLINKVSYTSCIISKTDIAADIQPSLINDSTCSFLSDGMSKDALLGYVWLSFYLSQDEDSQELYGHQGNDFIKSCSFNGKICTVDDFKRTTDFDYGNCFTFNAANESTPALKTTFVGPYGGLELELDIEVDKYVPFTTAVGARMQVHDPYRDHKVAQHGVDISPGFATSVALSRFMTLRLPKPYKDHCHEYPVGDSREICNDRCLHGLLENKCFCSLWGKGETHCNLTKMSDLCCIYSMFDEECDCPLSCNDTYYETNIFSAIWPSSVYYRRNPVTSAKEKRTLTKDEFRETRLKLRVYYDNLETIVHHQEPMYQSSQIFSTIGGQISLWLGLSLVSLFECIEHVIFLWNYRSKKLTENKKSELDCSVSTGAAVNKS